MSKTVAAIGGSFAGRRTEDIMYLLDIEDAFCTPIISILCKYVVDYEIFIKKFVGIENPESVEQFIRLLSCHKLDDERWCCYYYDQNQNNKNTNVEC